MTQAIEDIETYLARNQRKEMLRFLTCGSVDDGKSTLIGRLLHDTKGVYEDQLAAVKRDSVKHGTTGAGEVDLALLTDGLKAEREQGITIDVAYRYFSTDKRKFIIADTPGHEQYTRNMATGASTCQLAIILIDARHGVMTQTRRHSFIVSLLGIQHVVVAINKMDLVNNSQDRFEEIKKEYTDFAAKLEIRDIHFIPMSALKGDNVVERSAAMPWYQGTTLLNHLESVHIASDRNLSDMRFPVQYVLRPNLNFRGFAGTIASGIIKRGDAITALPSGKKSKIKSITTYDGELQEAFAGMAVTVTLEDEIDVSRGDILVHPTNLPHVRHEVEAMVVWMHEKPLAPGKPYLIKNNTRMLAGELAVRYAIDVNTVERRSATGLALNEVGRCTLSLNQPIVFDPYKKNAATGSFIIIDRLTNNTVAAGMIVDPDDQSHGDHWGDAPSAALIARDSLITPEQRQAQLKQKPLTILITGLTGAGKADVAFALEKRLFEQNRIVHVLYGSNMRSGISKDLGFSADDRSENLRRAAEVARILNDAGLICICAFVAPHAAVRRKVRQLIGPDRFVEIFLDAPVKFCQDRDNTGLYAKAQRGEIANFPGISAPYETPTDANLVLPTDKLSVDECVERIMTVLKSRL
jgi:bifunctional enzyme CysN/CysC